MWSDNQVYAMLLGDSTVFSALTLLVGHQEKHLACKNWVMRCWCGYLSGARCRLFAYGSDDATASPNPTSLASFKSRLVLLFWYWLTQAVLEKRLLNGCSSMWCQQQMLANVNILPGTNVTRLMLYFWIFIWKIKKEMPPKGSQLFHTQNVIFLKMLPKYDDKSMKESTHQSIVMSNSSSQRGLLK